MLEIRYDSVTKEVTGWRGSEERFGLKPHPGQVITKIDTPLPDKKEPRRFLFISGKLEINPDYPTVNEVSVEEKIKVLEEKVNILEGSSRG